MEIHIKVLLLCYRGHVAENSHTNLALANPQPLHVHEVSEELSVPAGKRSLHFTTRFGSLAVVRPASILSTTCEMPLSNNQGIVFSTLTTVRRFETPVSTCQLACHLVIQRENRLVRNERKARTLGLFRNFLNTDMGELFLVLTSVVDMASRG